MWSTCWRPWRKLVGMDCLPEWLYGACLYLQWSMCKETLDLWTMWSKCSWGLWPFFPTGNIFWLSHNKTDPVVSYQVVLCENNIYSQGHMNDTLTHELVHSYDHCRAQVDWNDIHHLACSEIRAANLSGECFFWKENFARFKFGWRKHHQVRWLPTYCAKSTMHFIDLCEREGSQVTTVCERHTRERSISGSRSSVQKLFSRYRSLWTHSSIVIIF